MRLVNELDAIKNKTHKTGGKKMLTMNEFKEAVTKDFKRFLDESFKDKEMVMYPLYKMNIAKTAISFKSSLS
mgnify:CR=1 FL=1